MPYVFDPLLSASPTGEYLDIYSTFSLAADTSVYNANLWGGGGATVDFTSVGHRTSPASTFYCKLTAITKRHAITSQHNAVSSEVGQQYTWIAANGTRVTRSIIDVASYVGSVQENAAFHVVYLDSDLPNSISPCPLSASYPAFLIGAPVVKTDQFHRATVADIASLNSWLVMAEPGSSLRATYYQPWIGNDSGSPAFLLYGGQLVYLTSAVGGGAGAGPNAADRLSAILAACADLDADNDQTGYVPEIIGDRATQQRTGLSVSLGI